MKIQGVAQTENYIKQNQKNEKPLFIFFILFFLLFKF
jgi:hypothetical protein